MKALKYVLIGLVGLLVLIALYGWTLPSSIRVTRSLTMKAKQETLYGLVNNMKAWELWSPWHKLDPKMQLSYSGPAEGVGASYTWKSEQPNVGNGTLTITQVLPMDSIGTKMVFDGNEEGFASYKFSPSAEGVTVTWTMYSNMGNVPFMRILGSMLDGMVGPDFERGLQNLSRAADSLEKIQVSESAPAVMGNYTVYESQRPALKVFSVRRTVPANQLDAVLAQCYGGIGVTMKEQRFTQKGNAMAVYYTDGSNGSWDVEAIMAVNESNQAGKGVDAVKFGSLPAVKHLTIDYTKKPSEEMKDVYTALFAHMESKGMKAAGAPWEEYVLSGQDGKWLTRVCLPVQ